MQCRVHGFQIFGVVPVEIMATETFQRRTGFLGVHLRIPVVTAEHLVRALAALHHLDAFRNLFREQVKGDRILADHGFGHLRYRFRQPRQHLIVWNMELMMARGKMPCDGIGVFEFVASLLRLVLEADGKSHQVFNALLGQQRNQQT